MSTRAGRMRVVLLVVALAAGSAACDSSTPTPSASPGMPSQATVLASPSPSPSGVPASAAPSGTPAPPAPATLATVYASDYSPEPGKTGGRLVIGDWQSVEDLNPYFGTTASDQQIQAATMRSLFTLTADGRYEPDLAAGALGDKKSLLPDKKGGGFTIRARLRKGLTWSDGQPLTMRDFAFTWKWVTNPAQTGIETLGWDEVDKVTVAANGLQADFHFKPGSDDWLLVIGRNPPLPQHYVEPLTIPGAPLAYPLSDAIANAVVSGPYRYAGASAAGVELVRNPSWQGPHRPYLDKITLRVYQGDKDTLENAFVEGAISLALNLSIEDVPSLGEVPPATGAVDVAPRWAMDHLTLNLAGGGPGHGHPALADPIVRQAIAMAIDRTGLFRGVFPAATGAPFIACASAPPQSLWTVPDAARRCLPFDPGTANAMLDAAGYARGADGIRVDPKSGAPLSLLHCAGTSPVDETASRLLGDQLAAIGIGLRTTLVDSPTVLLAGWDDVAPDTQCNLSRGNYDTALFGYNLGLDMPSAYGFNYGTTQIPTVDNDGAGFNYGRVGVKTVDQAITTLTTSPDPVAQVNAGYRLQQTILGQALDIPLYYRPAVRAVAANLHNFAAEPSWSASNLAARPSDLWNVEDWWLSR